jgi:hypothetical protein
MDARTASREEAISATDVALLWNAHAQGPAAKQEDMKISKALSASLSVLDMLPESTV